MQSAVEAQDRKSYRVYRPPPQIPSVEPSLTWKHVDGTSYYSRRESISFQPVSDGGLARLHPLGVNPYRYYHVEPTETRRHVGFSEPKRSDTPQNFQKPTSYTKLPFHTPQSSSMSQGKPYLSDRSRSPSPRPPTSWEHWKQNLIPWSQQTRSTPDPR